MKKLGLLLVSICVVIAMSTQVGAIASYSPDFRDYDPRGPETVNYGIYLVTSKADYVYNSLDAPESEVVVYMTQPTGTIQIRSGQSSKYYGQCAPPDSRGDARTRYRVYSGAAPVSTNLRLDTNSDQFNKCDGWETLANVTSSWNVPAVQIGDRTLYPVFVKATIYNSADASVNAFRIRSTRSSDIVSFYSNSGAKFALQDRTSPHKYTHYKIKFGTDCRYRSNITRSLQWFDADDGASNQDRNVFFRLYEIAPNGSKTKVIEQDNVGGNAASRSRSYTFKPNHKYEWIWYNIDTDNGIQFQVPFNSVFHNVNCEPDIWHYRPARGGRSNMSSRDIPNDGRDYNIVYAPAGGYIRMSGGTRLESDSDGWAQSRNHSMYMQVHPAYQNKYISLNRSRTVGDDRRNNYIAIFDNRGASPPDRNAYFNVSADTPHGTRYCLRVGVNNYEGEQPSTVTSRGIRWTSNRCWVVLQRYNITNQSISASPDTVQPGDNVRINFSTENTWQGRNLERYSGGYRNTSIVRVTTDRLCQNHSSRRVFNRRVRINGAPGGGSTYSNNVNCVLPNDLNVGDDFCFTLQIFYVRGYTAGYRTYNGPRTARNCVKVTAGPYFGVERGSVFAGLAIGDNRLSSDTAFIASSAATTTGEWVGGVSEFAALALNQISGFSSAVSVSRTANTSGTPSSRAQRQRLMFANTPSLGNFGSDPYRQADLYQLYNDNLDTNLDEHSEISGRTIANMANLRSELSSGDYTIIKVNGNLRLGTATSGIDGQNLSHHIVFIVNGNVRIDGDIKFFRDNYSSIEDIPSFTLITNGGTINVGGAVSRIDGSYITSGDFNSCNNAFTGQSPRDLSTGYCTNQLIINGRVVANRFLLKRTYGSTTGANTNGNTNPAEIFSNAPEIYLAPPPSPIPNLPGVSSQLDLPPLF